MPFCAKCGQELSAETKFCPECGTAVRQHLSENPPQRKQTYEGEIRKCPNCGEVLRAFTAFCPACGYELRGVQVSYSVHEFALKIEQAKTDEQRIVLICSFPIPNTKEDIFEFIILASTNVRNNLENSLSIAWQSKIEQAYQKAKLVFQGEKEFSYIQSIYNQACAKISKDRRIQTVKTAGALLSELLPILPNVIIVMGWLISLFILIPLCGTNLDSAGTNAHQFLLMIDFIAGAILLPLALRCEAALPKLITVLGLILSIVVLIPCCGKNLDAAGFNSYQLILVIDIVCSIVILIRMFKYKTNNNENKKTATHLNEFSFIVTLISIASLLIVYGIGNLMISRTEAHTKKEAEKAYSISYEWPSSGLSAYLPKPDIAYGKIISDSDTRFNIDLYNVTQEEFEIYVNKCKEMGFTIGVTKTDSVFYAYTQEEYELNIFYRERTDERRMSIFLDAPMEMSEFRWPANDLTDQIPKPESMIGNISQENSKYFRVYIANTTSEQYAEYVDMCMNEGFTIDYSRTDNVFRAYNRSGYYLVVEQHLFDKIYISIEVPKQD